LEAFGEGLVLQNFCHAFANNDAGRMAVAGGNLAAAGAAAMRFRRKPLLNFPSSRS
jgi:hypothetical protein